MSTLRLRIVCISLPLATVALALLAQSAGTVAQQTPAAKEPAQQAGKQVEFTAEQVALFENEILPILRANCFKCHGDGKVKGDLSLASREGMLKGGALGPAVSLEKPDESVLLRAIRYKGDLRMPPTGKLTEKDVEVLTRWVKAGVPWSKSAVVVAPERKGLQITDKDREYWAYRPVKRPAVPVVKNKDWVRNPIDAFILAGLEAKGLSPAPPADRLALARRVYYDLTGLPPTPEQIDAFVNDPRTDAYERLVDQLLCSPHYGEKWARHWLDLVRYGETNGFEFDQVKPFVWRYRDYVIGAFNKDMPYDQFIREQIAGDQLDVITQESLIATGYYLLGQWDSGAADRVQHRYDGLDSILSTTGQVFLGMSMGCVRCHDHKADPIPHRDYYRMLAFFHNISDLSGKGTRRISAPADRQTYEKQLKEKQDREAELSRHIYQLEQKFALALQTKRGIQVSDLPASDLLDLRYRFYRDTWEKLPDFDPLLHETEGPIAHNYFTLAPASRAEAIGLVFEGKLKVPEAGAYTFDLVSTDGARLLIDGKVVLDRPNRGRQAALAKVNLRAGLLPIRLEYFNTYDRPFLKVEWTGPDGVRRPLSGDAKGGNTDLPALIRTHGAEVLGELEVKRYEELVGSLEKVRKATLAQAGIDVLAVNERGSSPTYVLIRGNPRAQGDRVEPGFPEVLLPTTKDGKLPAVKGGRLALANWLTDPSNPLTARVLVNRLWQHHFGRGIVPSSNDFGRFGLPPTHPELLDWLASEFVARSWKIKEMHRLIMTSSAYRMSSKGNAKALTLDPANTFFWRFEMRRLTAEEVRDSMLAVSGRLNLKMAGPSIYPPIPREVLAGQARPGTGWKPSPPDEAARRSVYIHIKRSLLVPILEQFDFADTDASCPVRFTTTVPTQSLGMLNGDFSNEQAAAFARRLLAEAPQGLEAQVTRAIRLTTGRIPTAAEVRKDIVFVEALRQEDNLSEQESLRFYCLMLLNTNEFIYLD